VQIKRYDTMSKLGNSVKNNKNIEFKEEQRRLLPSSRISNRCSSLGLNSNNPLLSDKALLDYYAGFLVRAYLNKVKNERINIKK